MQLSCIMIYLLRWSALFLLGGQLSFFLMGRSELDDLLTILGLSCVMWLTSIVIYFTKGRPQPPKFLDTQNKKIVAAIAAFFMGFFFGFRVM